MCHFIHDCDACNVCNFFADLLFSIQFKNCDVCNLKQTNCFRFYFRSVSVVILVQMAIDNVSCALLWGLLLRSSANVISSFGARATPVNSCRALET